MKILGREELWIHTHFLTDCTRLPEFRMREILKEMGPFLRESGIAFGLHFTRTQNENEKGEADMTSPSSTRHSCVLFDGDPILQLAEPLVSNPFHFSEVINRFERSVLLAIFDNSFGFFLSDPL